MNSKCAFNLDLADKQLNLEWADLIEDIPNNPYVARCQLGKKMFFWSNKGK